MKNKLKWDDALDVWGVHGVGGILGTIALGLFGSTAINASGANGLLFGGADFFFKQLVAVVGASAYAFFFTFGALKLINLVTPVRTSDAEEADMDVSIHGESAYIEAI